ncbi:hypothetical protein AMECASPLE_035227, partial [Ameca splendens]
MLATSSSISKDPRQPPMQSPAPAPSPTADTNAQRVENGPILSQNFEMKHQPEPSAVLSQLAQRQQQSSILPTTEPLGLSQTHAPQAPTPPGQESSGLPVREGSSPGSKLSGLELSITDPPQRQLKNQRRRAPLPSKIPSSAVEMPGSADISGLNVQFGALDFGSEAGSVTADSQTELVREHASALAQVAMPALAAVPVQQAQSSMFPTSGPV